MSPYELVLEFARADDAGEPFAFRFEAQEYQLRGEGGVFESAPFPWSPRVLADLAELEKATPDRSAVQRLGNQLRGFLGRLDWGRHEAAIEEALAAGREVRLTVRSAAAELYALPWELLTLKGTGQHLGELPGCTLRYEWPRQRVPSRTPPPGQKGRILFAWSSAGGGVPADAHQRAISRACAAGHLEFDARRDVLSHVSLRGLSEALAAGGGSISVLHLLCHGGRSEAGVMGLWFEASVEGGEPRLVDGAMLRQVLAPHAGHLRMVVLSACRSGSAGEPGSHLGSVAQELHRVGVPAVVASRLPLSVPGSIVLTEVLYGELLEGLSSLERALGEARRRLVLEGPHLDWASLQLYTHTEDTPDTRPVAIRPYRGLLPFEARHRRFFFGREALSQQLLRRVREAATGRAPRFQVVAGASGAGKSSVVMAGLVPLLPADAWDVLVVRPGELVGESVAKQGHSAVLLGLRRRLRALSGAEPLPPGEGATEEAVLEEARRLCEARPGRALLLVVDQLEEVFTQLGGVEECTALMRTLWRLAQASEWKGVILGTLRVDHFERCGEVVLDESKRLDAVVYDEAHRVFVPQLAAGELAAIIEKPARLVGLAPEDGLVDKLCRDVGEEPGALPLLEYALDLLWQRREAGRLTHEAYEELGGVTGALTRTADGLYASFSPAQQRQARRLLVRLVDFRDAASPQTRRRAWVEEVRPVDAEARADFDAVLERWVGSRLLVKGGEDRPGERDGTWVQFAHEALIRRWESLQAWVKEDWEREQQLREVDGWARAWESHQQGKDKGASYLLMGDRLGYARRVQERYGGELSASGLRLIAQSDAAEARRRRRTRQSLLSLATLLVLALVGASMAWLARQEALAQKSAALDSARLVRAETLRQQDPTLAALLLKEVMDPKASPEWRQAAVDVLTKPLSTALLDGHSERIATASFSPDGARVVTASDDGTARVWRTDGSDKDRPVELKGHENEVSSAAFSPDAKGTWVLTVSVDGTGRVWRADGSDKDHPLVLKSVGGRVLFAAFSPDGERVVVAFDDGMVRVWRTDGSDKDHPLESKNHESPVLLAAFSREGTRVVTVSDKTVWVWRADGSDKDRPVELGHEDRVSSAAFSPDGTRVVTACEDSAVRVWRADGSDKDRPRKLQNHEGPVSSAAFSPDGTQVVTVSGSGTARVWWFDEPDMNHSMVLGLEGDVQRAAFSPDGTRVVTASYKTVRVWRADGSDQERPLEFKGHENRVSSAAFSPDGTRVVTASDDGTARVWRVEEPDKDRLLVKDRLLGLGAHHRSPSSFKLNSDGTRLLEMASYPGTVRVWRTDGADQERPVDLGGDQDWMYPPDFSPDGSRVVGASRDGTVRVWRADGLDQERPLEFKGHWGKGPFAAFSPDGTRVVTASDDGTVRVWRTDGADQDRPLELKGHESRVSLAAFSPDGARVVTAFNQTARVWRADGSDKERPLVLKGHGGGVSFAAFSPDGTRVVTLSNETAYVWRSDGSDKEHPLVLKGHESQVSFAAFSLDGAQVVTVSGGRTVRVWRADGSDKAHPLVLNIDEDGGWVSSAALSRDGIRVVMLGAQGTVRTRVVDVRELRNRLETTLLACLSVQQRQRFLAEPLKEAQARQSECQRAHGGTPASSPSLPQGAGRAALDAESPASLAVEQKRHGPQARSAPPRRE